MPELEYRVKLRSPQGTEKVVFDVTPDLSENRTVNYKTVDPIHAPGQIYAYVNSTSRSFQLSGVKLISRTQEEAQNNLEILWRLRGWTMPAFGADTVSAFQRANRNIKNIINSKYDTIESAVIEAQRRGTYSNKDFYGADLRGAPPQVLQFSAYSHDGQYAKDMAHINRIPVVITSLNIPYPSDVDYFPTISGVPMPSIMSIDIALAETHSPKEFERFSLTEFKKGILPGF